MIILGITGLHLLDGLHQSDNPPNPFELFNKRGDLLKHALLFGQVLRIKGAHLRQNGIKLPEISLVDREDWRPTRLS